VSEEVVVDHRGAPVERTRWRTGMVLAHTLSGSARIVGRATLRRLDQDDVDRTVARWCRHVFRLARATVTAQGVEHVVPGQAYVLLSNHTSLIDIPAVLVAFPGRLRFVAKEELGRVPVFGRALREAGVVLVDRGDRARAIGQLEAVRARIGEGTSVWIAATGGRSLPGELGAFKKGGFHVSLQLGVPILPTWIAGASEVIAPSSWASTTGQTLRVAFGPPIPTAGLGRGDLDGLMARAREALLACRR
jgi:1-acyl-sn-glycerol-3-phosphate acyltransferase